MVSILVKKERTHRKKRERYESNELMGPFLEKKGVVEMNG